MKHMYKRGTQLRSKDSGKFVLDQDTAKKREKKSSEVERRLFTLRTFIANRVMQHLDERLDITHSKVLEDKIWGEERCSR